MHLIYQLNDAIVTLTIKLDQSPHKTTFMTVSADFQGVYGLGQDSTTIECKSTGTLEDNILALAGAQMSGAQALRLTPATLSIAGAQDFLDDEIAAADEHAAAAATAFPPPENSLARHLSPSASRVAVHPALQAASDISRSRGNSGIARRTVRARAARRFFRFGRSRQTAQSVPGVDAARSHDADRHVILWHACVFTGVMALVAIPYALGLRAHMGSGSCNA